MDIEKTTERHVDMKKSPTVIPWGACQGSEDLVKKYTLDTAPPLTVTEYAKPFFLV